VAGVALAVGLVAVAWTALMVWGAVWALTGRNRVLLIVGSAVSVLLTGLLVTANLAAGATDGIVFALLLFAASVATVVLVCVPPASRFFAACRSLRRGR
jgi:hypothetical protein